MQSNVRENVLFATPKTDAERTTVANACWRKLGIKFPALVDSMDNHVEAAYTGWPDRLYLVDRGGRIVFKTKPGPFGFDPDKLAAAMQTLQH
jgi:type I thyroxine 5'-deiodinase